MKGGDDQAGPVVGGIVLATLAPLGSRRGTAAWWQTLLLGILAG